MIPYEIIDHTSDCGLKIYGNSLEELFANAAIGMFEIIAGKHYLPKDKDYDIKSPIKIEKESDSLEELLVGFLSELLYKSFKEKVIFRRFDILALDKSGIIANAFGIKSTPSGSPIETEIKAVTFHNLKIESEKALYHCTVIFDV